MRARCRSVRVNDVELCVYVNGEGPTVLLLHGFPDSMALWRYVIPVLEEAGYKVIAPDQRGFGESDAPRGAQNYRLRTLVSDAVGLLDQLDISKAHLVAHDYGALVGWVLAGDHSERFYSYTTLSVGHPKAYATGGWEQKRRTWYRSFFRLPVVAETVLKTRNWMAFRKLVRNHPETSHWIKDLSRPGRLTAAINWYRANVAVLSNASAISRVNIPVMGVWSSQDFVLAEDQMMNSMRYVDSTFRYARLENCGHWIPLDVPGETTTLLLDFLAEHTTSE